jgi:sarcosine oxidase subunit beta
MWREPAPKSGYDVVVIGAGVHGLSVAYHLAKLGITNVAVLDRTYLGGGNSGRNTQIIRANQRTHENVVFYDEALRGWEQLSQEVNFNMLVDQVGLTTLAHNEFSLERLKLRAEVTRAVGVESYMIGRDRLGELFPTMDLTDAPRFPVLGALYHPRGGVIRHDAVVWGYARAADKMGVDILPHTEVTNIGVKEGRVASVSAGGHEIRCQYVVNATAGWCSTISEMVGVRLPIVTIPLQACVTEPLKPFMTGVIMSGDLAAYFYQTDRGEVVLGAEIDPYTSYSYKTTLPTLEVMTSAAVEIMPCLSNVNIIRSWAGICDMTPDFSPIMCESPQVKGFVLDVGWGTYGFKTAPAAGKNVAELIKTGQVPDNIKPFTIARFYDNRPVDEKASAGTAH